MSEKKNKTFEITVFTKDSHDFPLTRNYSFSIMVPQLSDD